MYKEKDFDFSQYGAFFAFSDSQLNEGIKKHGGKKDDYVSLSGGLCAKKTNAKGLWKKFAEFNKLERLERVKHDGLNSIIKYELSNYESYYTGDITEALNVLKEYGATQEQVQKIFDEEAPKCEDY